MASTGFALLRIKHKEALESVAHRPDAHAFERTSYCVAPVAWRALPDAELEKRVFVLVQAGIAKNKHALRNTDDPTGMALLGFGFEWVPDDEIATRPWTDTYFSFRVEPSGDKWHILRYAEAMTVFPEHLGLPAES